MRLPKAPLIALLMAIGTSASATPYYEFIPYYGNDPFVFCTLGVPQDCWVPIDPALGTFTVTYWSCFNPVSAALYTRVCPHAFGA